MLRILRRYHSSAFKEGDLCLLRQVNRPERKILTKPLQATLKQSTHKGEISHDDIIGALPRSKVIQTNSNIRYSITRPTLEDFIEMSDRDAQPIYSQDAATIVTLADLHVDYPKIVDNEVVNRKHFLEAGTGHGSLTISIAKAIHAANAFAQNDKNLRGAVLHTIDNREQHSKRGQKNIQLFNDGMYANDVDFHINDSPSKFLEEHELSGTEFLSGAFLDMPNPDVELVAISKHLLLNSPVLIFSPSITQILKVVKAVKAEKSDIRLTFTKCIELQTGGFKEWDVRSATIRATGEAGDVARPKVGVRVVGGGFVAIFRKIGVIEDRKEKEDEAQGTAVEDSKAIQAEA